MIASDVHHPSPSLADKLARLYTLNREKTIDLGFRPPFLDLLKRFNDPHLRLPPVVHVAGTNGKGSTISLMRAMLEAEGYKVHVYTSPHLVKFNERIVLAGKPIEDSYLEQLIDEALALNAGGTVTFFEITTVIAFAAFAKTPADIVLLETGMGGRLDCTNIVPNPIVTIITSVGYDHMEHLGETLEAIANEKAGIIKNRVPCVIGPQNDAVNQAITTEIFDIKMKNHQSDAYRHNQEWAVDKTSTGIRFTFDNKVSFFPSPALVGHHQIQNAGTALAALHVIRDKFPVSEASMTKGLTTASWPARLQKFGSGPLMNRLPGSGWELWLDGGHNEDAAIQLAAQARVWHENDAKPLYIVLAMMNHKDPAAFVRILAPHAQAFYALGLPGEPKAFTAEQIAAALKPEIKAFPALSMQDALDRIHKENPPGRVLMTGSLYLAGHILKIQAD